jgi:hypothetical protein
MSAKKSSTTRKAKKRKAAKAKPKKPSAKPPLAKPSVLGASPRIPADAGKETTYFQPQTPTVSHNRIFIHPSQVAEANLASPRNFDYPVFLVGSTAHFDVYSARSLGSEGTQLGQAVLQRCEQDYAQLAQWFGLSLEKCNAILAPLSPGQDGTGGAYHHSCIDANLYCDVQLQPQPNSAISNAVLVAEVVEVFEAVQNRGWNCGASNGEGLSRVLAETLYPNVLDGYATAAAWLDYTRPDWVSYTNATDQEPISNGCAVLFLYWLHVKLGFGWDQICSAAAATLAGTYQILTGKDPAGAFPEFKNLLDSMFPNRPSGLTTDNPF